LNRPFDISEKGSNGSLEVSEKDRTDKQGRGLGETLQSRRPMEADRTVEGNGTVEENRPPGGKVGKRAANKVERQANNSEHPSTDKPESKGRMETSGPNRPDRSDEKQHKRLIESRRSKDKAEPVQESSRPGKRSADKEKKLAEEKHPPSISQSRPHGSQSTCAVVSRYSKETEKQEESSEEVLPVFELEGPKKDEVIRDILNEAREKKMERLNINVLRQEEGLKFSSTDAGKMYSLLLDGQKDAFRYCNTFVTEKCLKHSYADLKWMSVNRHSNWHKARTVYVEKLKTILGQRNDVFDIWTFEDLPSEWVKIKGVNLCSKAELEASPEKRRSSDTKLDVHGLNRKKHGRGSL
jgi:hypothetical protein